MLEAIARQWAQNDPQAALNWAQNLADTAARNAALPNIIASVAENDPRRAAQILPRLPAEAQASAAGSVISQWAARDPAAAGNWAVSFPEGKTREQIFQGLMTRWAGNDPAAAANWLGGLRDGPSRDQAVTAFSNRISSSDPVAAAQWAATIGDENLRNNQMESTARTWLRTDPGNASTWITNSSLPDEAKRRLLNPGG